MRNALTLLLSVVLVAGALSAVVATATVQWLYPTLATGNNVSAGPSSDRSMPPSAEELLALDLVRKAGSGDLAGSRAIAPAIAEEQLKDQMARLAAAPVRAARLPAPPGEITPVLVWADYRAGGMQARGMYQVNIEGGKATAVKGPLAPPGGLTPLTLNFQDEEGRKVSLPRRGPMILVAPRTPQAGLADLIQNLHATYAPQGIEVALVIDMRSPDWAATARAGGYTGPVWHVKARLDDVPVVGRGEFLGAYGVLVDREGNPVASLAALNPLQYDLRAATPADVAPIVLRAYGLLP